MAVLAEIVKVWGYPHIYDDFPGCTIPHSWPPLNMNVTVLDSGLRWGRGKGGGVRNFVHTISHEVTINHIELG